MMTMAEFGALLDRQRALQREHDAACATLDEEGTGHERCLRLHAELADIEDRIAADIAAELAAEERPDPASEEPPAA